jgi:hypothetical protein
MAMLQQRGRVSYRALKLRFSLDNDHLRGAQGRTPAGPARGGGGARAAQAAVGGAPRREPVFLGGKRPDVPRHRSVDGRARRVAADHLPAAPGSSRSSRGAPPRGSRTRSSGSRTTPFGASCGRRRSPTAGRWGTKPATAGPAAKR